MIKLFIFFCFAIIVVNGSVFPPLHDKTCGYTRDNAFNCALKWGDLNHDKVLSQSEIKHALGALVPWYVRAVTWFSGMSLERSLQDCDYDKNGVLTAHDWKMSESTCMPRQEDLCTFKWFCDRLDNKK